MNNDELTSSVMKRVVSFEKRRISRFFILFTSVLAGLIFVFVLVSARVIADLNTQGSWDILDFFREDWEIISEFWQDSVLTFLMEFPVYKAIIAVASLICIGVIILATAHKRDNLQKKIRSIDLSGIQYYKEDMHMAKNTIVSVVIVVILALAGSLFVYMQTGRKNTVSENNKGTFPAEERSGSLETEPVNESPGTISTTAPSSPMTLTVSYPLDRATVSTAGITVKGTTSPQAEVFVNETEVVANANGAFSAYITLEEGDNYIVIVATDQDGNSVEKEMTVNVESSNE